ncbi:response regulator [Candidatus Omnitrophota bacterium]
MSKKILVIDDDPNVVKMLKSRLEASNYRVATASNGNEGLEQVSKERPDLILCDIVMPIMDGYTFLNELRAREMKESQPLQSIPVFVLTAKEKMQDLFAMEGIKEYIVKPFKAEELLEKIKNVLK